MFFSPRPSAGALRCVPLVAVALLVVVLAVPRFLHRHHPADPPAAAAAPSACDALVAQLAAALAEPPGSPTDDLARVVGRWRAASGLPVDASRGDGPDELGAALRAVAGSAGSLPAPAPAGLDVDGAVGAALASRCPPP